MELKKAIEELRKGKKRKFSQGVDLLVNLKGLDLRRDNVNVVVSIPHKIKEKKVCGFLEKKSNIVRTITQPEFKKYSEKDALKALVKEYDFFIAIGKLMPAVATNFGKVLGPAGKMPSPQLGIIMQENDSVIKETLDKIGKAVKIRAKEPSIKLIVGNESMSDGEIIDNVKTIYKAIENALPKKKENVKNVLIKFTMTKPLKVEIR